MIFRVFINGRRRTWKQLSDMKKGNERTKTFICSVSTGDSNVDFLYYFATVANETHPGLARVDGSPIAGEWNNESGHRYYAFLVTALD